VWVLILTLATGHVYVEDYDLSYEDCAEALPADTLLETYTCEMELRHD
jgi:hypothetical protein